MGHLGSYLGGYLGSYLGAEAAVVADAAPRGYLGNYLGAYLGSYLGAAAPAVVTTTTAGAIRNRIIAVVAALTPGVHADLPFVAYRDESGADFRRWARAHPRVCTRHFQARTVSNVQPADVSNTDVEARLATFDVIVAYARRWRAGQSFDRDDTMEADQLLLENAVGRNGYANFAGANPNASWLGAGASGSQTATTFERDEGPVDFLVIRQTMRFYQAK